MFLRPCHSARIALACHRSFQLESFTAVRSLTAVGSVFAGVNITERSHISNSSLRASQFQSQLRGHRPMPWAGQVACSSNHALQHLNGLRRGLLTTQTLARQLAPYAGGVTALSAGSFYLHRQQKCRSRRRSAFDHGVALVETNTPASMQQSGNASSSGSEPDTGVHGTSEIGSQSDDK